MTSPFLAEPTSLSHSGTFNIRDFGAIGDGITSDTEAIRATIAACAEAGGGTVFFPPGDFLCGSLHLVSNLTLHLSAGATLREEFTDGIEKCRVGPNNIRPHFLMAHGVKNLSIIGQGTILGRGEADAAGIDKEKRGFRTGLIHFDNCEHIRLSQFTIRFGDAWTVHLCRCENVFIQGVSILNNIHRRGGNDGLDLNSCRNVHISNCRITAWDDCIVLKTKDLERDDDAIDQPCENIVVTNCTFVSGCTALKLGSESKGAFRDIHFSNCVIRESSVGCGIYILDGATVERVSFTNISMEIIDDNRYRRHDEPAHIHIFPICVFTGRRTPKSPLGVLRDILFRDIQAASNYGVVLLGDPESSLENVSINHMTLRTDRELQVIPRQMPCSPGIIEPEVNGLAPALFNIRHVKGLRLCDVIVLGDGAPQPASRAFSIQDSQDSAIHCP